MVAPLQKGTSMKKSLLAILALTLLGAAPADAKAWRDPATLDFSQSNQELAKGGPAFKAVATSAGNVGFMFGGQGASYLTESFYLGGAGYGGTFASGGTVSGGVGYGGMLVGSEQKLGGSTVLDLSLLVGGGGGAATQGAGGGSFALEPGVSVSRLFGNGVRGGISLGYLYMPTANSLSGATVGLNLAFKTLTFTFPIDD
jgi:hypothetical protein